MIATIRRQADRGLRWNPVQVAFRIKADRSLAVLAYHGIDDADRFMEHVSFFRRHMHPIGLHDLIDAVRGRSALPRRALLLTFDDGHRSLIDVVMPALRDRGLPGVAFVIPGLLDSAQPFWWVEVEELVRGGGRAAGLDDRRPAELIRLLKRLPTRERVRVIDELRRSSPVHPTPASQLAGDELRSLEAAGIEIGNHTHSHASLARSSRQEAEDEIVRAHDALAVVLGHPPRAFAYPNGDWDRTGEAVLRELGYEAAFLFDHRIQTVPVRESLRISRLRVGDSTGMDRLRIILSGLHPAIHRIRGLS